MAFKITNVVKSLKKECEKATQNATNSTETSNSTNLKITQQNVIIENQNKLIEEQNARIKKLEEAVSSNNVAKVAKALAIMVNSQPEMIKNGVAKRISKTLGYDKDKDVNSDVSEGSGNK